MNSWNEKTTLEKIATVISGIALLAWLVFGFLERRNAVPYAEIAGYIAVNVLCICEAICYWRVKRVFSYIAIAGVICMVTVLILLAL